MNAYDPNLRAVPENVEAEGALLGAILINNAAFDKINRLLEPQHFYEPLHRKIYEVIGQTLASGRGVNPVTIRSHLPTTIDGLKIDGEQATVAVYLARLCTEAVTIVNAADYALAVFDAWVARQAIGALQEGVDTYFNLAPGEDPLKAFEPIEERMAAVRAEALKAAPIKNAGQSYVDALSASYQRREVNGVPIALDEIAEVISEPCFEGGNLYGLLSSSGEGKTSLTVQLMLHAMKKGHPVCFLSYDQSSDQVLRQMVAQEHEIEARRQRDAKLLSEKEFETCMNFAQWVGPLPFEVVKCTDQSAPQLVGIARTFVKRYGNGNGFAEKVYSGRGALLSLNPMPYDTVVERLKSGDLRYKFNDRGKTIELPEEKVFHLKAFGDGDVGMSPVEYARQTLGTSIASERAAGQMFGNGMRAKGFFTFPTQLSQEQREQAKKNFAERYSGPNAPGVGILEAGVDFKPVNINPRDAEMLMNRRFNVEEICRWLGTPPIIIGHAAEGQTMWGTGVSAIMQSWLNLGLRSYLKRIEKAISKRVMTPEERRRFKVRFNYEDLLRGDTAARSAFYTALLNAGVVTINEVRRLEGLAPVVGGDIPRTQMQNVPITDDGKESGQ